MSRWLLIPILALLTLLPALTLFHQDELGHWTLNRCAMSAPDEHSYLLMAENIATGHGPSIKNNAGSETFYPPGFPLILAAWAGLANLLGLGGWSGRGILGWMHYHFLTIESAHACVTTLLCATVPLVFVLTRRLLALGQSPLVNPRAGCAYTVPALFITALYASNWFVLDTAIFVFSEPAFLLFTLLWLYVAVRWPRWYESPGLSLLLGLLAAASMSIRGAGIVCAAATLLYPMLHQITLRWSAPPAPSPRRLILPWCLAAAAILAYVCADRWYMPKSPDAYSTQLLRGLCDQFPQAIHDQGLSLGILLKWAGHIGSLMLSHFADWTASFVPPYRDSEVSLLGFDRPTLFQLLASVLIFLALLGWLGRLFAPLRSAPPRGDSPHQWSNSRLPALYILLYVGLYLIWPFNMIRFWVPIYPIMLAYAYLAIRDAARPLGSPKVAWASRPWSVPPRNQGAPQNARALFRFLPTPQTRHNLLASLLALCLLTLFAEELILKLPFWQRRLNYVSDVLADTAAQIKYSSDINSPPVLVVLGGDEAKMITWYLGPFMYRVGGPPLTGLPGRHGVERQLSAARVLVQNRPHPRIYFLSYFTHDLNQEILTNLTHDDPHFAPLPSTSTATQPSGQDHWTIRQRYRRWNIVTLWELQPELPNQNRDR